MGGSERGAEEDAYAEEERGVVGCRRVIACRLFQCLGKTAHKEKFFGRTHRSA